MRCRQEQGKQCVLTKKHKSLFNKLLQDLKCQENLSFVGIENNLLLSTDKSKNALEDFDSNLKKQTKRPDAEE
jgi:hypothetical protein